MTTAVILHYADYRGDHAADARKIVMLDVDTTLGQLLKIVEDATNSYGAAKIEITSVGTS